MNGKTSALADTITCQNSACSTAVSISLEKDDLPAADLVWSEHHRSRILTPDEAWSLERDSDVDLSTLEPDPSSDIWSGASTLTEGDSADQALPLQPGDVVDYSAIFAFTDNRFRFNVQTHSMQRHYSKLTKLTKPAESGKTLTLLAARDLHVYLLKKELLRRLGYRVPAMKYLPQVKVRFPDAPTRDLFFSMLKSDLGDTSGWLVPAAPASDPLIVTLQDLVALEATAPYPNLAFSAPVSGTLPETSRPLRALALAYGLAGVQDSVQSLNRSGWSAGKVVDGHFTMNLQVGVNFGCALDDALWMLRRVAALSREDFSEITARADFPDSIAKLVVEKLIARRDSLVDSFKSELMTRQGASSAEMMKSPIQDIAFDATLDLPPEIVGGKVIQKVWPGYATQFAFDDQNTPLQDIWYYPLSLIESNVIEGLINEANTKLPSLTIASQTTTHLAEEQLARTGLSQKIPFGIWAAPVAGGGLVLSRNVVIGSFMGTNNLVSLADTFGFQANAGLMVGVDGIPAGVSLDGVIQGSVSVTYTHIKPLDQDIHGLKNALSVPLNNMLVSWLYRNTSNIFQAIADAGHAPAETPDQVKAMLQKDMADLANYLDVGESLILLQSATGSESLTVSDQLGGPVPIAPGVSLTGGANEVVLSRLRILRKTDKIIEVFVDGGQMAGLNLSFGVSLGSEFPFPILAFGAQTMSGSTDTKLFSVSIDPDPSANPQLFTSALALASLFKNGDPAALEQQQKPAVLTTQFTDSSSQFSFLFFQSRTLSQLGQVHVALPSGFQVPNGHTLSKDVDADFIALGDGSQYGSNFQQFFTNIGTYLVQRFTGLSNLSVDTQASQNPGQTLFGNSKTHDVLFQGIRKGANLGKPLVQIVRRWEGWKMSPSDFQSLNDQLSRQYEFKLFADGALGDAKSIQLYDLALTIDFYESAIQTILSLPKDDIRQLVEAYDRINGCDGDSFVAQANGEQCSAIKRFQSAFLKVSNGIQDPVKKAQAMVDVISGLEQFLDFHDILLLLGDPKKSIYISATLNGVRDASESFSTTIPSNTYGTFQGNGVIRDVEGILGVDDGEFDAQWVRGWL